MPSGIRTIRMGSPGLRKNILCKHSGVGCIYPPGIISPQPAQNAFQSMKKSLYFDISPFFKNKNLNDITCNDIQEFYDFCKGRNLPPKVLKNTLALLNQMIKYFQNLGIIDRTCNFQVRRLSDKTKFTVDRIIFEV